MSSADSSQQRRAWAAASTAPRRGDRLLLACAVAAACLSSLDIWQKPFDYADAVASAGFFIWQTLAVVRFVSALRSDHSLSIARNGLSIVVMYAWIWVALMGFTRYVY